MKLKLIVLAGAKEGTEIPLRKDKFLIGRAKECALRAGSEAISRRHCAIIRRESGYTVRDLGSRNGTHVNGEKITAEVALKDGDELRVGPLTFSVATAEPKVATSTPSSEPATPKSDKPRCGSSLPVLSLCGRERAARRADGRRGPAPGPGAVGV